MISFFSAVFSGKARPSFFELLKDWLINPLVSLTLPETNSSPMKITIFPGKYHQNGGFSMAMLVYRRVVTSWWLNQPI